jgi:hypothetical protein
MFLFDCCKKKRLKNPIKVIKDVVYEHNQFELRISSEHGTIKLDKFKYGYSLKIPIDSDCSVQKTVNLLTHELSFEYHIREDFNSGRIKKQEISQNDFDKHFDKLHYNIQKAIAWDVKSYYATNHSYSKTL